MRMLAAVFELTMTMGAQPSETRRLRQSLENAQGRAAELERLAGRYLDRLASAEARVKTAHSGLDVAVAERDVLTKKLADSERAFQHLLTRLDEREQQTKQLVQRVRELESALTQRTKELARAERVLLR